jgi:hypothetical protein
MVWLGTVLTLGAIAMAMAMASAEGTGGEQDFPQSSAAPVPR